MPVLIDGNNLLFAARSGDDPAMARSALCERLGQWAGRRGEALHVVFDGPAPAKDLAEQIGDARIRVSYSGRCSADEVLTELLNNDSAARRLLVVSSDGEVNRAAKRRRARSVRSQDFWATLVRDLARPERTPLEPRHKRHGPEPEETERWLREFGFREHDDEAPR